MRFPEWEGTYLEILSDLNFDRSEDEGSARMLKAICMNSDIVTEDILDDIIGDTVAVFGNGDNLESDIERMDVNCTTLISSGSAVGRVMEVGLVPDMIVTDLDGDIRPQLVANMNGAIAVLHAHGDNYHLIQRYAPEFKGRIILTTQSTPDNILSNYGGFTDGDRAVCIARHFGARRIYLMGFDFDDPSPRTSTDPEMKKRKLSWAKRIIFKNGGSDIETID